VYLSDLPLNLDAVLLLLLVLFHKVSSIADIAIL
jgi:hypothetical protein